MRLKAACLIEKKTVRSLCRIFLENLTIAQRTQNVTAVMEAKVLLLCLFYVPVTVHRE